MIDSKKNVFRFLRTSDKIFFAVPQTSSASYKRGENVQNEKFIFPTSFLDQRLKPLIQERNRNKYISHSRPFLLSYEASPSLIVPSIGHRWVIYKIFSLEDLSQSVFSTVKEGLAVLPYFHSTTFKFIIYGGQ